MFKSPKVPDIHKTIARYDSLYYVQSKFYSYLAQVVNH